MFREEQIGNVNRVFMNVRGAFRKIGWLTFDKSNEVIPDKSIYYRVVSKDTINYGDSNPISIYGYVLENENVSIENFRICKFDSSLTVIKNSTELDTFSLEDSITINYNNYKQGYNFLQGIIYLNADTVWNEKLDTSYSTIFYFYHDFYVK